MADLRDLLSARRRSGGPIDPLEIFDGLTLRHSQVAELWRPQSDALRDWHANRTKQDVLFKLNTGAGKTLLGLLAAQSLVNESQGKVIYICATNQLLEQTSEKAAEYGIDTAEYYGGEWRGDAYHRGSGPGLTNYQAVFNGKSVFQREDLAAAVFDDAHTAHGIIRDQYTVRIARRVFPALYDELVEMVKGPFEGSGRGVLFADVTAQARDPSVLFVPTFVSAALARDFLEALTSGGVSERRETLFAWEHLKNHLQDCAVFIDRGAVEFTPPLPPVHGTSPFGDNVRRLYLSATLPDDELFCRTFVRRPDLVIEPGGRAGDTERMLLPAHRDVPDSTARDWARRLLGSRKALIMVPSFEGAEPWADVAEVFESSAGHERVRRFAESEDEKLVLVARYDGVDLPGDACRLMVIDGLPVGVSLVEKFFENHLEIGRISDSVVASRFTQMLGRISRGMADYGVVIILGQRLIRWIDSPTNRRRLPPALQNQLELSDLLAARYGEHAPDKLVESCLTRDESWLDLYDGFMEADRNSEISVGSTAEHSEDADVASYERRFIKELWDREYSEAAAALDKGRSALFEDSRALGAWYLHWQAHALSLLGESDAAEDLFRQASRVSRDLGQLPYRRVGSFDPAGVQISAQAQRMTDLLGKRGSALPTKLKAISQSLATAPHEVDQSSNVSTADQEEGVRFLGECLGLEATRPDADERTGPDVLWRLAETDLLLELKTAKTGAAYTKDEVGQIHNHVQWALDSGLEDVIPVWVGPRLPVTEQSSPPEGVMIVLPQDLARVADQLASVYEEALSQNLPLFRAPTLEKGLEANGFMDGALLAALAPVRLSSLGAAR